MKKIKIGINGFGRIGRAFYRIALNQNQFEIVAINDINPDVQNLAYLIQFDSTYGRLPHNITCSGSYLKVGEQTSQVFQQKSILEVPWEKLGCDVVIDSSGIAANVDALINSRMVQNGPVNYIVTNTPKENIPTIIFGVNENEFDPRTQKVVSSSICDTIALTPIIKNLKTKGQLVSGYLTTLHPWLSYQNLLDGPSVSWSQPGDIYSHYALGRSSINNVIPKSTSAVRAADKVFSGLSDKLQSFSFRVPTSIVSSAVLIALLDKNVDQEDLVESFLALERSQDWKVIKNSSAPLTSVDYIAEEYSAVIDHRWTKVENGNHIKLVYWYDNEWGYTSRVYDVAKLVAQRL